MAIKLIALDLDGTLLTSDKKITTRTKDIIATKGRASYLGERSLGHRDPGAVSSSFMLRAMADTM